MNSPAAPDSPTPPGPDPVDPGRLRAELERAAAADRLVVVSDFDGVLARFVDDPTAARPEPAAIAALRRLAGLPRTRVALVSGRGRDDLAGRAEAGPEIELVGSHGAEWASGMRTPVGARERELLERVVAGLEQVAAPHEGAFVEVKQASAAVHYRRVPSTGDGEAIARAALEGPGSLPGVHVTTGKNVVELAVVQTSKGTAVEQLRAEAAEGGTAAGDDAGAGDGAAAPVVLFCGDDVTDEKAFAVLGERDLAIKVGPGPTLARLRVPDIDAVTNLYRELAELRERHTREPY